MKYKIFLIFLIFIVKNSKCFISKINSEEIFLQSVSGATVDVINKFFIENDIKFDFIIYGEPSHHIEDIVNEVTRQVCDKIKVEIRYHEIITHFDLKIFKSSVIFTKTIENLKELHRQYSYNGQTLFEKFVALDLQKFKFLIYAEDIETEDDIEKAMISDIHSIYSSDIRFYEFFIIKNKYDMRVYLAANVLFSEYSCTDFAPKLLNQYDIDLQIWEEELKNFNHFDNLYGCLISFGVLFGQDFFIEFSFDNHNESRLSLLTKSNTKFWGATHEIFNLLAKKHNITKHYTLLDQNNFDIITGSDNFMINRKFIVVMSNIGNRKKYPITIATPPLYHLNYYYLVSPNDLYSNYEKLLMPFDVITWILLAITIWLSFIIIFISYQCPKWFQTLIHGEGIDSPFYNALGIIFGISQLKLPTESVNRAALLIFIWFCLMFRTCYQSMLFEFMTSDMRKPLPASIEDLIKYNYEIIYLYGGYYQINDEIIGDRERPPCHELQNRNFSDLYQKVLNGLSKTKYAFLVNQNLHGILNSSIAIESLATMENERTTSEWTYGLPKNVFLSNEILEVIKELVPTGIIQYLYDFGLWVNFRPFDVEEEDPRKVLSLSDLEFGFVLWIASLSVPLTCFLCEIFIGNFLKMKKALENYNLFLMENFIVAVLRQVLNLNNGRW